MRWRHLLIGSLLRIDGSSPYGSRDGGEPGIRISSRSLPVLLIRFGFLVAIVAAFVPSFLFIGTLAALAFALATAFTNRTSQFPDFGLAAFVAVITTASLHLPWSYDILQRLSWRWLIGPQSPESGDERLLDLLEFATTDSAPNYWSLGLIVAALLGLIAAPTRLFGLATQCWTVALFFIGFAWIDVRGWLPFDLPTVESMLAPALAALVVVVAIAVRGAEEGSASLSRLHAGARRAVILVSGACLLAGALGATLMSLNGGWHAPTQNYPAFTQFLAEGEEGPGGGRVLWIGDASVVPNDVVVTPSGTQYAVTDGGTPEVWGRWSAGPVGATRTVGDQLDLARAGETVRLGRLLAPYGISLVVVLDQLAPAPYEGPTIDPGADVVQALTPTARPRARARRAESDRVPQHVERRCRLDVAHGRGCRCCHLPRTSSTSTSATGSRWSSARSPLADGASGSRRPTRRC